ncbi:MAG: complex I NDUFA9 subunit family protein [Salaquimonas sp.]
MTNANKTRVVTVFGGSGFVGRHVVRALAKRGYRVVVAVRRPDLAGHLQPLGDLGQIKAIQANIRVRWSIDRAVKGADAVINLVGTFDKGGKNNFNAVQVFGARAIAEAARQEGAQLIHMSAIGADVESNAGYSRSKGEGEKAALSVIKNAIVFRPSVVFGPEDDFFNRFAQMAKFSPFLPLIGGGHSKFQPVYVGDVAEAVALAVDGKLKGGKIYELGGPKVATFKQCLDIMQKITYQKRGYISLPWFLAKTMGKLTGWLPGAPVTLDQVKMLEKDTIVSDEAIRQKRTLEGMGINPSNMETILPSYLVRFRPQGQFTRKGEA